ncbi:MAG: phenylalanine--tRNA ligase subunit alpha [Bacteroidetes bacterium GWE2_29_8]|nr:MAG: phenylalanine--tRNA ligase subunit alpha [Bacteroidetes bacterium GWE2_29_8]OFY23056.1 MAG: phenylalanine--tRNA ligase subunit alpha [Bacteroidetes bacterium GWF2_29_10]
MLENIQNISAEIDKFNSQDTTEIENFRIKYLGKKGILNDLFEQFKNASGEEKRALGKPLNELKTKITEKYNEQKSLIEDNTSKKDFIDMTLPVSNDLLGSRHPINIVMNRIIDIFKRVGFNISYGPEIEDDWHNFSALNFPQDHPARDMQDTFFVNKNPDYALRTHTSSVQIRVMENTKPPIRTISPGRVFRNEAISARAHCIFHQVEALYIDKNVSMADLKQLLLYFAKEMFGSSTEIRLRPSYFPFTEPSAELDVSCNICKGKGCNVCKHTGWLEILGCGMVDPNVLKNCNIDPDTYTGYALGMGVERIAMLEYEIKDLRLYFENDIRFLKQFSTAL